MIVSPPEEWKASSLKLEGVVFSWVHRSSARHHPQSNAQENSHWAQLCFFSCSTFHFLAPFSFAASLKKFAWFQPRFPTGLVQRTLQIWLEPKAGDLQMGISVSSLFHLWVSCQILDSPSYVRSLSAVFWTAGAPYRTVPTKLLPSQSNTPASRWKPSITP